MFASKSLGSQAYAIWGLTRQREWIACTFTRTSKDYTYYIENFSLTSGGPHHLKASYDVSYLSMWNLLGNAVREWSKLRREELEALERLEQRILFEDRLVDGLRLQLDDARRF